VDLTEPNLRAKIREQLMASGQLPAAGQSLQPCVALTKGAVSVRRPADLQDASDKLAADATSKDRQSPRSQGDSMEGVKRTGPPKASTEVHGKTYTWAVTLNYLPLIVGLVPSRIRGALPP
jgi:hypothetical protein